MAAAAAALGTVRGGPRGRVAVLDFFSRQLAPRLQQQAGDAADSGGGGGVSGSRALRTWLRRVSPLAGELAVWKSQWESFCTVLQNICKFTYKQQNANEACGSKMNKEILYTMLLLSKGFCRMW